MRICRTFGLTQRCTGTGHVRALGDGLARTAGLRLAETEVIDDIRFMVYDLQARAEDRHMVTAFDVRAVIDK